MNTNKPERLLLSGSDYFQLLLDRHHRQHGLQGNVGRFSVEVKGRLDACQLEKIINNDPIFCWLHSLRLKAMAASVTSMDTDAIFRSYPH